MLHAFVNLDVSCTVDEKATLQWSGKKQNIYSIRSAAKRKYLGETEASSNNRISVVYVLRCMIHYKVIGYSAPV